MGTDNGARPKQRKRRTSKAEGAAGTAAKGAPRKAAAERQVRVRPAAHEDIGAIARTLARAFADDPYSTWLFPDPSDRIERSARLYALESGFDYVPQGLAEVAVADGRVVGAATWRGPGSRGTSLPALLRGAPHFIALFGARRTREILAAYRRIAAHGPARPHWYLAELAADPDARGTGAGSALLRSGLARADADGVPVYLESSKKENIGFYERFGFAPTGEIDVLGLPPLYGMVREPESGPGALSVPGPRTGGAAR
ncbi:GNAT family N-acetyltransferase [Nocardiopsis suaedae]|uniref:GNAT family N-acetyltransferase n=1 Tax=Nocardiopsis suaedae TaxID=3018444 RepID=A0ABT4TTY8_9ACTN|nr:GNAT family N-acetyltransferase [Nocardiopsis suaedae]MDA2808155.1 GNAT family N-acetyltransferase [Nocardiopsis suaedae]